MDLLFLTTTESTNIEACRAAEAGAAHGNAVWALEQTAGRGRLGKVWSSRRGDGLYVSYVLRPQVPVEDFAKITLVAGVAAAKLLQGLMGREKRVALKWPNDLFIGGRKIAGILAEASPLAEEPFVILGVGLNIRQRRDDFPEELREKATSIFIESGSQADPQELAVALRTVLLEQLRRFEQGEFPQILNEWRKLDYLKGKRMECVSADGFVVRGVALGPDDEGVLFLRDDQGKLHEILSGDVSLAGQEKPR